MIKGHKTTTRFLQLLLLSLGGLGVMGFKYMAQKPDRVKTNHNRQVGQDSKTFTVEGTPRVKIETFDGVVTIHTWNKPEVMFIAKKSAQDQEEMRGISLRAEQSGGEILIAADFDKAFKREVEINGSRFLSDSASVDLEVYLPQHANLSASTADGEIKVENLKGEVDLNTRDGAIRVSRMQGRLQAKTEDGEIALSNFDGTAEVHSGDGMLNLDGRFSQLTAYTANGLISVTLPSDVNANVETRAHYVQFSGGLNAVEENTNAESLARRWRIGAGGDKLTLQTGRGDIVLRATSNNAAPWVGAKAAR
jgi:DUF4097 and DUF4098 domain-containing protein YvlB